MEGDRAKRLVPKHRRHERTPPHRCRGCLASPGVLPHVGLEAALRMTPPVDRWVRIAAINTDVLLCPACFEKVEPGRDPGDALHLICDGGRHLYTIEVKHADARKHIGICVGGMHTMCRECTRHWQAQSPDGRLYCRDCIVPALQAYLESNVTFVPGLAQGVVAARALGGRQGFSLVARDVIAKLLW